LPIKHTDVSQKADDEHILSCGHFIIWIGKALLVLRCDCTCPDAALLWVQTLTAIDWGLVFTSDSSPGWCQFYKGEGLTLDKSVVWGLAAPWGGHTSFSGCGPFGRSCHQRNLLLAAESGRFSLEVWGASLPGFVAQYFAVRSGLARCGLGDPYYARLVPQSITH
jgi:hypothetical protein